MPGVFYTRDQHRPVSNTERQRQFRKRNPGYYARLHAKRRAPLKALAAARLAAAQAASREANLAPKPEPLLLPAPAVTIEIPGVNSIPTRPVVEAVAVVV